MSTMMSGKDINVKFICLFKRSFIFRLTFFSAVAAVNTDEVAFANSYLPFALCKEAKLPNEKASF